MSLRYFQDAFLELRLLYLLIAPTGALYVTCRANRSSFRYFWRKQELFSLLFRSLWIPPTRCLSFGVIITVNTTDPVLCFLRLYFIVFFALIHVSLIDDQVDPQINKVQFSNKNNANLVYLIFDGKCKQSHAKENEPIFQKFFVFILVFRFQFHQRKHSSSF